MLAGIASIIVILLNVVSLIVILTIKQVILVAVHFRNIKYNHK